MPSSPQLTIDLTAYVDGYVHSLNKLAHGHAGARDDVDARLMDSTALAKLRGTAAYGAARGRVLDPNNAYFPATDRELRCCAAELDTRGMYLEPIDDMPNAFMVTLKPAKGHLWRNNSLVPMWPNRRISFPAPTF